VDIAVRAVERVKELAASMPETQILLEYSPESFSATETGFAVEICEAVMDAWGADTGERIIFNLPATVEIATPNVYADQIESFCRQVKDRERVVISVHPHNDRGCAVAAAELALMAGADRVEGTLFGNGERTGNVDVVTLALNMMCQGVDPELDVSRIDSLVRVAEECTGMSVHDRHPYAGQLVYTAFSGSHQDAIRKGMAAQERVSGDRWEVPYLPIDPADVGRSYEAVIRINSQSGKGGVAYVMEQDYGYRLPRALQVEFSSCVQQMAEEGGGELASEAIWKRFETEYLTETGPFELQDFQVSRHVEGERACRLQARVRHGDSMVELDAVGSGPLHAFVKGMGEHLEGPEPRVVEYAEHALGEGADARAVAYVQVGCDERVRFGVATDADILAASLEAVIRALNWHQRDVSESGWARG
jgi:2-isopropylmalate synthase